MAETNSSRAVIAHILPWDSIGGTELQTLRLAEAAREGGFRNIIYTLRHGSKVRRMFEEAGFPVFEYEQVHPSYTKPLPYLRNCRRLAGQLREQGTSIVHSADVPAAYFTAMAGRFAGARVISHVRNHYPEIPLRDRGFLRPVERFVFVSKATREQFAIPRARKHGTVLYDVPGIAFQPGGERARALEQFGIQPDHFVFGMASRVAPQKDFPTLIKAARRVVAKLPACTFLIAGDYQIERTHREHYVSLQPLLARSGVGEHFRFAGFQSDMRAFFAAIDAFVLSTHFEGLPTVALEAMLYRKPVICTDVGGISEAITDGVNGLLAPPKSAEVLADKLLQAARDKPLVARMTKNACATLEAQFGRERFLRQVEELYSGLLRD
jgi:glycosyltransferase involved in cell wall biosynthesis